MHFFLRIVRFSQGLMRNNAKPLFLVQKRLRTRSLNQTETQTKFKLLWFYLIYCSCIQAIVILKSAVWEKIPIKILFKTGSQTEVQNYRPIALLPSLSKVFEQLLHKHIYNYLEHHKLLIPNNSGFRKKHSTLNSLLSTCNSLYQLMTQISPLEMYFLIYPKLLIVLIIHVCSLKFNNLV